MEANLLLREYCKKLRLPTLAANASHFDEDAARENLPYERFLLALLEREVQQRALNQERRRIQGARFPVLYTLDTFNFDVIPQLNLVPFASQKGETPHPETGPRGVDQTA